MSRRALAPHLPPWIPTLPSPCSPLRLHFPTPARSLLPSPVTSCPPSCARARISVNLSPELPLPFATFQCQAPRLPPSSLPEQQAWPRFLPFKTPPVAPLALGELLRSSCASDLASSHLARLLPCTRPFPRHLVPTTHTLSLCASRTLTSPCGVLVTPSTLSRVTLLNLGASARSTPSRAPPPPSCEHLERRVPRLLPRPPLLAHP